MTEKGSKQGCKRNRFVDFLIALLHPSTWIQVSSIYSDEWDIKLRKLLQTERFKNISHFYATLGDYEIWIANVPYASMVYRGFRPRRATILRAYKILKYDLFKDDSNQSKCHLIGVGNA